MIGDARAFSHQTNHQDASGVRKRRYLGQGADIALDVDGRDTLRRDAEYPGASDPSPKPHSLRDFLPLTVIMRLTNSLNMYSSRITPTHYD